MKNILIILSMFLFITGCQPDDIPGVGEPFNRKDQLVGTWKLKTLIQVEEDAKSKGFPEFATSLDITNIFAANPYTDFSLTLNADETFSTELGESYVQMLSSGTWNFDNDKFPTAIILTSGEQTQTVLLGSLAELVYNKVQLKIEHKNESGKAVITYEYNLSK